MHNNWEELIPFYVAGTLPRTDTSRLEKHLSRCDECRRSLGEWQAIAGVVRAEAASQLRDLPPLSAQVLRIAGQQAASRSYHTTPLPIARPARRYNATSITLIAAVFTVIVFGGLLALMLRGTLPQPAVVLVPTATTTLAPSQSTTPVPPTPFASSTLVPQIIVIEPSDTPISPSPSPTRVPPTSAPPATRLPPTQAPSSAAPLVATQTPPEIEQFSLQASLALKETCTIHPAIPDPVRIYGGPGAEYPILSTLAGDDELTALGVTDNGWYRVEYPPGSDLGAGWVQREQVSAAGNCDSLPLIPVASPTPTPTDTALPFETESTATPEETEMPVS